MDIELCTLPLYRPSSSGQLGGGGSDYGGIDSPSAHHGASTTMSADDTVFHQLQQGWQQYESSILDFAKQKALRIIGLQPIPRHNLDTNHNIDDTGANPIIQRLNDSLQSPNTQQAVAGTAQETAAIAERLLTQFNQTLSTPAMKQQTSNTLHNVGEYSKIVVDALDEPLDHAIDKLSDAGARAASGIAQGAVKVASSAVTAIPGVGAVVALGRIANDVADTAANLAHSAKSSAATLAELTADTNTNVRKQLQSLQMKQRERQAIVDRTQHAISAFHGNPSDTNTHPPPPPQSGGARRTAKSKHGRNGDGHLRQHPFTRRRKVRICCPTPPPRRRRLTPAVTTSSKSIARRR